MQTLQMSLRVSSCILFLYLVLWFNWVVLSNRDFIMSKISSICTSEEFYSSYGGLVVWGFISPKRVSILSLRLWILVNFEYLFSESFWKHSWMNSDDSEKICGATCQTLLSVCLSTQSLPVICKILESMMNRY